ncbi:MAG: hypothetical protein SFV15_26840 [Polyangiaceae bacterium]|nr:hypothetical protein [Polyangiaceae bacterium]
MEDELKRLREVGSPEEQALVAAARAYEPSRVHQDRLFLAMGLGVSGGLGAGAVAGSAHAASGLGKLGALIASTSAATKGLLVSGVVAVSGASLYGYQHLPMRAAPPPESASSGRDAADVTPRALALKGLGTTGAKDVEVSPESPKRSATLQAKVAEPPAVAPREASPVASAAVPAPSLKDELSLIQRAQVEVQKGSGSSALRLLEEHRRTFTHPKLGLEARALRVRALAAAGQGAQAEAEARAFIAEYPRSLLSQPLIPLAHFSDRPPSAKPSRPLGGPPPSDPTP